MRVAACSSRRPTVGSAWKCRARATGAAPVAGLRNACGVGPRTVFATFPPPDACNVGHDYVAILARYRLDFGGGSEQNGKTPPKRHPKDPVESLSARFRRDFGDPAASRPVFGDWESVP